MTILEKLQLNNTSLLDLIYPVGSVYISSNSTSPETLFGGTWAQIKDKFILACGDTYSNGSTGGKAQLELTAMIGAYNNNAALLGYVATDGTPYLASNKPTYIVTGTGLADYSNYNHGTVVTEQDSSSRYTDNMPPYIAKYMWERTK